MYLTFRTSKKAELDKTEKLITSALSTEIELPWVPLLPVSLDSTGSSYNNNCNSELKVKIELTQINDELSITEVVPPDAEITDDQPPTKNKSYPVKKSKILLWVMSSLISTLIWHKIY